MNTVYNQTSIHCTTDDGWRYSAYRTRPGVWAPECVSPEGDRETLRLVASRDALVELASKHQPQQTLIPSEAYT